MTALVDPRTLIGHRLIGVVMGSPSIYFLRFGSGVETRVGVSGNGSLELAVDSAPNGSDFQAIDQRVPFADVVGRTILGIDRVWWLGGGGVGLRLRVDDAGLDLAADEIHGGYEVSIIDGDLGEDWGQESIA
jgi:hypothetical protein